MKLLKLKKQEWKDNTNSQRSN